MSSRVRLRRLPCCIPTRRRSFEVGSGAERRAWIGLEGLRARENEERRRRALVRLPPCPSLPSLPPPLQPNPDPIHPRLLSHTLSLLLPHLCSTFLPTSQRTNERRERERERAGLTFLQRSDTLKLDPQHVRISILCRVVDHCNQSKEDGLSSAPTISPQAERKEGKEGRSSRSMFRMLTIYTHPNRTHQHRP